jgi:MFS transporter, PAT family, beta-lactamase induction signal transducer AmpG
MTSDLHAECSGPRRLDAQDVSAVGSITTVYMGQRIGNMLILTVVPTIYFAAGLDLKSIWIFGLTGLPIWLKWGWAPIIDRYYSARIGRRKSWIWPLSVLNMLLLLPLMLIEPGPGSVNTAVLVLVVWNISMATQDIAVDAYTTEQLDDRTRSVGAVSVGVGDSLGYIIGISVPLILYDLYGWHAMILLCAAASFVLTVPALIRRERPLPDAAGEPPAPLHNLLSLFRQRATPWILLLVFVGGAAGRFVWSIYGPLLAGRDLSMAEVGTTLGIASAVAAAIGGLLSLGMLARRNVLTGLVLAVAAGALYATFLWPVSSGIVAVVAIVFMTELLLVPVNNFLFVSRMAWCRPGSAGTDFTAQSSIFNFGRSVATFTAAPLAAGFGWGLFFFANFLLITAFAFLYRLLAPKIDRQQLTGA